MVGYEGSTARGRRRRERVGLAGARFAPRPRGPRRPAPLRSEDVGTLPPAPSAKSRGYCSLTASPLFHWLNASRRPPPPPPRAQAGFLGRVGLPASSLANRRHWREMGGGPGERRVMRGSFPRAALVAAGSRCSLLGTEV